MQKPFDTDAIRPPQLFGEGPQTAREEITREVLTKVRLFMNEVVELTQHDDVGLGHSLIEPAQTAEIGETAIEICGKRDGIAFDVVAKGCNRWPLDGWDHKVAP